MDGDWLREARNKLGLTQRQLAEKLMLKKSGADHVRHMERGRREVSGPIVVAVTSLLKETDHD